MILDSIDMSVPAQPDYTKSKVIIKRWFKDESYWTSKKSPEKDSRLMACELSRQGLAHGRARKVVQRMLRQ